MLHISTDKEENWISLKVSETDEYMVQIVTVMGANALKFVETCVNGLTDEQRKQLIKKLGEK